MASRIESADQAALALAPVAGDFAKGLFAFGLFGASVLAATVMPLTTSYAVCESFGWESGVSRKFSEAPAFMGLYTALILIGAVVVLVPGLPLIGVILVSQNLNGILLPIILVFMLRLVNNPRIMGSHTNPRWLNVARLGADRAGDPAHRASSSARPWPAGWAWSRPMGPIERTRWQLDTPLAAEVGDRRTGRLLARREVIWKETCDPAVYRVHAVGHTWAEATEGVSYAWSRERYDWSVPEVVTLTQLDSNIAEPVGTIRYNVAPLPDGGARIVCERYRVFRGAARDGCLGTFMVLFGPADPARAVPGVAGQGGGGACRLAPDRVPDRLGLDELADQVGRLGLRAEPVDGIGAASRAGGRGA